MRIDETGKYEPIATWAQLIDHIRAEYPLFYWAPMDHRPVCVSVALRKDGKVRVYPPTSDTDPFNADRGHLDRFYRLASRRTQ